MQGSRYGGKVEKPSRTNIERNQCIGGVIGNGNKVTNVQLFHISPPNFDDGPPAPPGSIPRLLGKIVDRFQMDESPESRELWNRLDPICQFADAKMRARYNPPSA